MTTGGKIRKGLIPDTTSLTDKLPLPEIPPDLPLPDVTEEAEEVVDSILPVPVDIRGLIEAALQALAETLRVTPAGPLTLEPATFQPFRIEPEEPTIPSPLPPGSPLPVRLTVRWSVFGVQNKRRVELEQGSLFVARPGLDAADPQFLFFPQLLAAREGAPPSRSFFIRASVTLEVDNPLGGEPVALGPIMLPEVPVQVPTLLIPTALALFRHRNFATQEGKKEGFVLLVLSPDAPLSMREPKRSSDIVAPFFQLETAVQLLTSRLNGVASQVQELASLLRRLSGLLVGLRVLNEALRKYPNPALVSTRAISNLNEITLIRRGFLRNNIEGEDEISSLILLSLSSRVECFNKRHFDRARGAFRIVPGTQLIAVVRDLDVARPRSDVGDARIEILEEPKLALRRNTFDNALSSLRFV